MNWYLTAVTKFADFEGRARRKEYWFFMLFYFVFLALAVVLDKALGTLSTEPEIGLFSCIFGLAMFVPSIAVTVRRLHDTDRSGWWYLIGFIPIVGPIWLMVLMVFDGQAGENRFGPDPKLGEP